MLNIGADNRSTPSLELLQANINCNKIVLKEINWDIGRITKMSNFVLIVISAHFRLMYGHQISPHFNQAGRHAINLWVPENSGPCSAALIRRQQPWNTQATPGSPASSLSNLHCVFWWIERMNAMRGKNYTPDVKAQKNRISSLIQHLGKDTVAYDHVWTNYFTSFLSTW